MRLIVRGLMGEKGDEPRAETMRGGHAIKNKSDPLFHQRDHPECVDNPGHSPLCCVSGSFTDVIGSE